MIQESTRERIVEGLGAAPGIGIGHAFVFESGRVRVPEYRLPRDQVAAERDRLREALLRARRQIGRIRRKLRDRAKLLPNLAADDLGYLLDAYLQILKDSRLVRGAYHRIESDSLNAEAAVQAEIATIGETFRQMHDAYLSARAEDIQEVGNRLLRQLMRSPGARLLSVPKGSIIIASELTPGETAQLDPEHIAGIAAQAGGLQSHTAILARALGLPAVLGAAGLLDMVKTGDRILIDGDAGQIVIHPTAGSTLVYRRRQGDRRREERDLRRLKQRPAITRDGTQIRLQANVELPIEMGKVIEVGAAGIGLLRTEFLFLNRSTIPSEEEQFLVLKELVDQADGQMVTIRTLDLGGDKGAEGLIGQFGESAASPLGLRGIRLALARAEILEVQMRAILRASAYGPVRILLPMVTTVAEIRAARDILNRAARRLLRRGITIPSALPPLGTMIEIPGAALTADALARVSDFFSVGSNDLTMYTLAIDRSDERVAHLYNPLHPAVLRMIEFSVAAAKRARIPLSLCGEMAGDPRFTALLLGLGFRELSMAAVNIPRVKHRILELDLAAAERRARMIMAETDVVRIQILLDEFNAPEPDRDAC
jgi:phosphotransferase system enzyme I (PtsI)